MASLLTHRLSILAAAALFSTGGAAIKGCGLDGWQVASFRSATAALMFVLFLPASRRAWSWRTGLVGLAYAGTMISFVLSNKLTTAANTIFLQSAAPIYVLILSPWLLRESIRRRDLLWIALVALGLGLFFIEIQPPIESAPDPWTGNLLALAAGLFWALTLMGLRWLEGHSAPGSPSGLSAVLAGNLIAALIALPFALPVSEVQPADWASILYLGVIQIGLAYILLAYGFRRVPAFEGTLLILLEPALSPVWAWVVQGEVPGVWSLVGGVIILSTCLLKSIFDQSPKEPTTS